MVRHAGEVLVQLAARHAGAGGIVRVAEVHEARAVVDGREHGGGIVEQVPPRHPHQRASRHADRDREHDEGGMRHHRLVPRPEVDPAQDVDEIVRSRAGGGLLEWDLPEAGEGLAEVVGASVGVAVHARGRLAHRANRERGGAERILVGRELDRVRDVQLPLQLLDGLAGNVGLQGADF